MLSHRITSEQNQTQVNSPYYTSYLRENYSRSCAALGGCSWFHNNVCNEKLVEVTEVPEADQREGAFLTLVLLGWLSSASYPSQRSLNSKYHSKAKLQDVRGLALFLDTLITSSSTMTTTSEVVMMQNQLPFVKLGSFSSFTGVLTRIHSRALVSKVQL